MDWLGWALLGYVGAVAFILRWFYCATQRNLGGEK